MVRDNGEGIVCRSIAKDCIIPGIKIGIICDAVRKGIPFVLRGDETRTI